MNEFDLNYECGCSIHFNSQDTRLQVGNEFAVKTEIYYRKVCDAHMKFISERI